MHDLFEKKMIIHLGYYGSDQRLSSVALVCVYIYVLGVWYVYTVYAYALNGINIEVILGIIVHGGSDGGGGGRLRCGRWLLF